MRDIIEKVQAEVPFYRYRRVHWHLKKSNLKTHPRSTFFYVCHFFDSTQPGAPSIGGFSRQVEHRLNAVFL
ncbi:MAG: hypothetical protein EB078_04655 [Proteobacteria bacterium]|nr:hypothetical protein [Pseudomonadota bacterium]NDD04173.1 hypothetical protein [Pseudomonadota bacterium]NDG26691.1 hypothetical protein [Pseudomonadota bacterium]